MPKFCTLWPAMCITCTGNKSNISNIMQQFLFLFDREIIHRVSFHFNVRFYFCLMIGRRVNACASPDWPKPLKQWGACGSALIQRFGCSMAHAGPDSTRKTNTELWLQHGALTNQ
jgi:hypothetical protein